MNKVLEKVTMKLEKTEKIIDEAINIRQNLEKRKESIYKDAEEDIVELILSISKDYW